MTLCVYSKFHEFEPGLGHPGTEKPFRQLSGKRVPVAESGMDKAVKGEGWAPLFMCCAQDTVGLYFSQPHAYKSTLFRQFCT